MWEIRDFTKVLGRWLGQVLGILVLLVGVAEICTISQAQRDSFVG